MGADSKIEWTDHTWNPWRGCDHCYAEAGSLRNPAVLGTWGPDGHRTVAAPEYWTHPAKWNRAAIAAEKTARVFSLSLGDWLEDWDGPMVDTNGSRLWVSPNDERNPGPDDADSGDRQHRPLTMTDVRARMLATIHATPQLDYLLLTKRPEGFTDRLHDVVRCTHDGADVIASDWLDGSPPPNIWPGASVEHQAAAEARYEHLAAIPGRYHWLSVEPLLGPIDLTKLWLPDRSAYWNALTGRLTCKIKGVNGHPDAWGETVDPIRPRIDWVIVGGESGPQARPMHPSWVRSLRDQCQTAGVPFFFKQWGEWSPHNTPAPVGGCDTRRAIIGDPAVDGVMIYRVGKRAAGRMLDGREWSEFPTPMEAVK